MRIDLKCFASLASYAPAAGYIELPEASTVATVISALNMPLAEVKIIFINGVHAETDSPLHDGDRLGLIPAVGGG